MIKVIVTSAGGAPGLNFTRSLRKAGGYYIIGIDANKYSLCRAEVDERYLVPLAQNKDYIPVLQQIVAETKPAFLHVQHSQEVSVISKHRWDLGTRTFLPKHRSVMICDSKWESYLHWDGVGIKVPRTMLIEKGEDITKAFSELGPKVWIRAMSGSGGRGAITITSPQFAHYWIEEHSGWGNFTISEYLSPRSVIWQSIWKGGKLIVAQGRERLYWEFGSKFLSGISGMTGAGKLISDSQVDEIAKKAIYAIDAAPWGVWGVDMTYDKDGVPNPTEINVGRFFTTHQFFTEAGCNMADMFVRTGIGEDVKVEQRVNPLPEGLLWIRGVDCLPIMTNEEQIEGFEKRLQRNITLLRNKECKND